MSKVGELNFDNTKYGYGHIKTLKTDVQFELHENEEKKKNKDAPDFNIVGQGGVDLGGAWWKEAQGGKNKGMKYLSLSLDDPSFTAAINVSAFGRESDGAFEIIWNRPRKAAA